MIRADFLGTGQQVYLSAPAAVFGSHQRRLCHACELGVTVVAGSDAGSCGVPHGIGFLRELHQMEQAGMPSMTVLRSATGTSAALLQFPEFIGRIEPGCRSRFIFTRYDPLENVANLQKSKWIIFDGAALTGWDSSSLAGM